MVRVGETIVADTQRALRLLETASPPTFYLPPGDVDERWLRAAPGSSHCEWKGQAVYYTIIVGDKQVEDAAWSYPEPSAEFTAIRNCLAFYPHRIACYVDGERVRAQAGGFYGGWITDEIVGPFKGEPGTSGW